MQKLTSLNDAANTQDSRVVIKYAAELLTKFKEDLFAVEMGVAYGGMVEEIANMWRDRGIVYGFDTFTGHPKEVAPEEETFERECMNSWYDVFGKDKLQYKYIRQHLDKRGLDNAVLVKGLINKDSCKDIPKIHLAFLDLDILESMQVAYEAVEDKIVPGGYLALHDVNGADHIPRLYKWYSEEVKTDRKWRIVSENEGHYIIVLERVENAK